MSAAIGSALPPTRQRRALVTGASRDIGKAIALNFAEQGFDVLVHYNSEGSRKDAEAVATDIRAPGKIHVVQANLDSSWSTVKAWAILLVEQYGPIDTLVLNAGLYEPVAFEDLGDGAFDKHFNVNLRSGLALVQALTPHITEGGRVIFFSTALTRSSVIWDDRFTLYAASKAAVEQVVRYLSKTLGPRRISVNAISPGPIDTHGLRTRGLRQDDVAGHLGFLEASTPLGRIGRPEDVAALCAFLVSEQAGWVNGQTTLCGGGLGV